MWKNVSRRLRDTVERCNLFEVHKTTVTTNSCDETIKNKQNALKCININANGHQGSNDDERRRFKRKFGQQNLHHSWPHFLGAITWSSAIICGWYTSQLICLRSRRRHLGWDTVKNDDYRCKYYKLMLIPSRLIHTNVLSHFVFNSPIKSSESEAYSASLSSVPSSGYHSQKAYSLDSRLKRDFIAETEEFDNQKFVLNVNNETEEIREQAAPEPSDAKASDEPDPMQVESAVQNLLNVLGDMEFQMGVQNILAGNYEVAVNQLKLSASHQHAGATFNLGLCFEQGLGVPKNMVRAKECYHAAALMGHSKAMYNLAIFYLQGFGGLPKDRPMARRYFIAAANLGLAEAKHALGLEMRPKAKDVQPQTQTPDMGFKGRAMNRQNSVAIT